MNLNNLEKAAFNMLIPMVITTVAYFFLFQNNRVLRTIPEFQSWILAMVWYAASVTMFGVFSGLFLANRLRELYRSIEVNSP